jgi:hypothetical protein
MPIEKKITKRNLESLRDRKNPCLKSTAHKRIAGRAVICQTHDDGKPASRLSRLHYAIGEKAC